MLEQTSKNRSAVLRNISAALENYTDKGSSWHQSLTNDLKPIFLIFFLHFQVFTEHLEHPEYPPRGNQVTSTSDMFKSFLSRQSRVRVTSPRVRVMYNFSSQSHDLVKSIQSRVTRTVESLRVIGLQARVSVESHEISRFFYDTFLLWNGTQHPIKWRPIS